MNTGATLRIALRALQRNKLRSTLTALGIIIGVGAVIAMVGIGSGAKAQVEAQIASLGQNVITVSAGYAWSGGARTGLGFAWTLIPDDAEAIVHEVPGVLYASPGCARDEQVQANSQNWHTMIEGHDVNYLDIRDWPLTGGSMFTENDVRSIGKVCVIGHTVAKELFPSENPVGQTLRLRNIPFKIVGVLAGKGFVSAHGTDQDDVVIVPYTSFMKRISPRRNVSTIMIRGESAAVLPQIKDYVTALLRQRHRIRPDSESDFTVNDQQDLAQTATATTKTMTVLLGAIASVSLIVGGIGIMNIMLVSVTERTREIGIRLAVGARGRDILLQFLIEAITLSSLGGILGIAIGLGSAKILSVFAGWPTLISVMAVVVAFFFSAVVGVFFGFYPARKASQLDPIEALRYE